MTGSMLEKALQAHLAGELQTAKNLYQEAIKSGDKNPAAHANLGVIMKEEGKLKEAIDETEKALSISPNNPIFLMNAGGLFLELNKFMLSIKYSQKSLNIQPSNPIALANLGSAFKEIGDLENAEKLLLKSLRLQPRNSVTLTAMGFLQLAKNKLSDAHDLAINAIHIDHSSSKAQLLFAKVLEAQGKLEQAKTTFWKSLNLDHGNTGAILGLSCQTITREEAIKLLEILNQLKKDKLNTSDLVSLRYAYANLHHTLKEYTLASKNLTKAHQTKSAFSPSNSSEVIRNVNYFRLQSKQTPRAKDKDVEIQRIFIVGMPRCGSTLLESVLSMNPNTQDLGESKAMAAAIQALIESRRNGLNSPTTLEELYACSVGLDGRGKFEFTIDKQLLNFVYSGLIASQMPQAKIIHCRRNPLDNILSMLRNNLGFGSEYTISAYDSALVLIAQENAMLQYKEDYNDQIFTFDYDYFVKDPQDAVQPLTEWLGFDWDENYLHPEKSIRTVNTASVVQARQPINSRSLNGWKNYRDLLKPAQALICESGLFEEYEIV